MKIDDTTKIVSLLSVIVGAMISVASYVTSQRLASMDRELSRLKQTELEMDVAEKVELKAARVSMEFSLPLARTFANESLAGLHDTYIHVPDALKTELDETRPEWSSRKHLMTGSACKAEGLKNRQIVTLVLRNSGYADATNVVVKVRMKKSPHNDPRLAWRESPASPSAGTQICGLPPTVGRTARSRSESWAEA